MAAAVQAPLPTAPAALAAANPATAQPTQRAKGLVHRLVRLAVTFGILTALSFFAIPETLPRAIMVIAFSAISGFSALCLLTILLSRGIRGRWRKSWAVAAAVVVAMEAMLVAGLNTYADSKATSATALVQDSYAEVAAAVSLGDAIQQGRAPSDVTFANVQARAFAVYLRLSVLDVPGQLADYTSSVKAWAKDVVTASIKAQTGSPWQGVPDTPEPFQVNMTAGQANAAFATSLRQIATLIEFGDHAVAARDLGAMRYVGARLDAQAYWLEGIYTSADPDVVAAQLHFIEPVNGSTGGGVAETDTGMRLVSLFHRGPWRSPRPGDICYGHVCVARVRGPLGGRWRSATSYSVACAAAGGKFNGACINDSNNQQWVGATQGILPMINASGAQPIGGPGASVGRPDAQLPPPLAAFYAQCQAQGGTYGGIMSGKERLPTSEGGWTCQTHGCWNYLTYSGTLYRGGQPGCPEQGLVPRPFGPVGGIVSRLGGFSTRPPSSPQNLPSGFPTNLPDGTYTISICVTYAGCRQLTTDQLSSGDIATFANTVTAAINRSAAGCSAAGSTCNVRYTPFDGRQFSIFVTVTSGSATGNIEIRVTKL